MVPTSITQYKPNARTSTIEYNFRRYGDNNRLLAYLGIPIVIP